MRGIRPKLNTKAAKPENVTGGYFCVCRNDVCACVCVSDVCVCLCVGICAYVRASVQGKGAKIDIVFIRLTQ